ncbi:MAG: SDR family NAD(P)-dependent oxidoreductase [Spirochaetales bacterium]|nr:SDR family NAD(P)-dependent oxidoreductase [Spirochaetales bacterium]
MQESKANVVLTGAAGGMGTAVARVLNQAGYQVIGLDIREPVDFPGRFIPTDITDPSSVEKAALAVSAIGPLRAIVHTAGIYDLNSLLEISEEDFIRIWNVNLFGIYRVNKALFPLLANQGDSGSIVIVSSELAPLDPLPFTGLYAVTKSAIEKYAQALRQEVQTKGCFVSVIRPGAVDTGMVSRSQQCLERFVNETKLYKVNAANFKRVVDRVESRTIPPQRIGKLVLRALESSRPAYVYKVNRNPGLLLLNLLPLRLQNRIIKGIITNKG